MNIESNKHGQESEDISVANFIINNIKKFIYDEYKEYLLENKILLIIENEIRSIVYQLYEIKIKELKKKIKLDISNNTYYNNLNSSVIDNIIFEIFSDKEKNLNTLIEEIKIMQNFNLKKINIPIIDNTLNINISLDNNYLKINSVNNKNIIEHKDIYNLILKYQYIYKIENIIFERVENDKKIDIIKELINNKKNIDIELYYIKK
jgi:hypothetical protein